MTFSETLAVPTSMRLGLTAAWLVLAASGLASCDSGNGPIAKPSPSRTPSSTVSPSPSTLPPPAIDATSWTRYTSNRYDFTVGHPPKWTDDPASRNWTSDADSGDHLSPAHEAFVAPSGHVRVSVWNLPLDPGTSVRDSMPAIKAWVEDYCEASGNTPCTGIDDRAVELCLESECHPGLLVPFKDDVQAFFSGGIYDNEAVTVVAVWRGESAPSVARYGGSQRLLEAFLSTMKVWPASTPRSERRYPFAGWLAMEAVGHSGMVEGRGAALSEGVIRHFVEIRTAARNRLRQPAAEAGFRRCMALVGVTVLRR